ncbi:MAG: M23 family metallopeptidase [Candidatus Dependentiae bacterium]
MDGYGRKVIIEGYDLNGRKFQTLYGHMDSISKYINECTMVNPGDILGKVGNSGASAGPHLHFGFGPDCKNHIYKDPGYRAQYVWENMTASYLKHQLEINPNFKTKANNIIGDIIKKYAK